MADFGLSAFAMFFMQCAFCLSFQRTLERGQGRSNCQTLFGIEKIPSDNYIRGMLDDANPTRLAPCFERMERLLLEPAMREAFGRLGGRTLVALDGTEYSAARRSSARIARRASAATARSRAIIPCWPRPWSPGTFKVVLLAPEFIVKQDGAEKQDCERNAVKRWHEKHGGRKTPAPSVSGR